jgi:MerR family transcriptional regulator, heat shock protein HspR
MRSISEVAQLLNVHTQTLRNWEKKGLLAPNRIGKLRVYSTYDIQRCQQIKQYSGRGIHAEGIKELLRIAQERSKHSENNGGEV